MTQTTQTFSEHPGNNPYNMPSRDVVLRCAVLTLVPLLGMVVTVFLALWIFHFQLEKEVDVSEIMTMVAWVTLAACLIFLTVRQWWYVARTWPKAISHRTKMAAVCNDPAQLVFVRNPEPAWKESCAQFERLERKTCLENAVPDNVQDLRGESLRHVLRGVCEALDAFGEDDLVIECVGFKEFNLLYEPIVEAIAFQLAQDVGLAWASIPHLAKGTRPKKLEQFLREFGVCVLESGDVDVDLHSDAPAALRRAIGYVLPEKDESFRDALRDRLNVVGV